MAVRFRVLFPRFWAYLIGNTMPRALLPPSLVDPSGSEARTRSHPKPSLPSLPIFAQVDLAPPTVALVQREGGSSSHRVMSRPCPPRNHATCRHLFCSICKWARFWKEWREEASPLALSLSPSSRKSQCHRLLVPLGCSLARSRVRPASRSNRFSKSGASGRNDLLGVIGVGSDDRTIAK